MLSVPRSSLTRHMASGCRPLAAGFATKVPSAPKVAKLKAYVPPRSVEAILKDKDPFKVLKIDYNEGTMPAPPQAVTDAMVDYIVGKNMPPLIWYPHTGASFLIPKLAEYDSLPESHFIPTNGSDDAMRLVCETFLETGDKMLVPQPSYPQVDAFIWAVGAELVPMDMPEPFENDEAVLRAQIDLHKPKIVYLITPNNPTGTEWAPEAVAQLCKDYPEIVFINDEAYVEFRKKNKGNASHLTKDIKNIVVTRTFSKCWGLSALRCGYLMAHPEMVHELGKLYNYKSVNQLAQVAAAAAIDNKEFYMAYAKEVNEARDELVVWCGKQGYQAACGGGNFACVKVPDGVDVKAVVAEMANAHGVWIRDIHGRFPGYFRVTIGTKAQMEQFKAALKEVLGRLTP